MSAGRSGGARAPSSTLFLRVPRPLLRLLPLSGAGAAGAGTGGGGGVSRRTRHLVQLLALLLAASGYGLLLASSALAPAAVPPALPPPLPPALPPRDPTDGARASPGDAPAKGLLLAQQAVLPRPEVAAGTEAVGGGAPVGAAGDGEGELDLEAVEAEMEARRHRVWEVCKQLGLARTGQPNAWEFFIDSHHSLVWCNIFKAASTAWLYNFNLLAGYSENYLRRSLKPPLALARARYPRPTAQQLSAALPESLSFLIVREPFERLLSAYRNKLEGLRNRFYRKLGREMAARHPRRRPTAAPGAPAADDPPLPGPTFQQFVDHVIASGLHAQAPHFDEHWAPYHRFCTPCHVNFTVIAKMETLARDEEYIIHRAGLENALLGASKRRDLPRKIINRARGTLATSELLSKYYGTLTRSQLEELYRIYGTDFEMFGYNASKYYRMVRKDE